MPRTRVWLEPKDLESKEEGVYRSTIGTALQGEYGQTNRKLSRQLFAVLKAGQNERGTGRTTTPGGEERAGSSSGALQTAEQQEEQRRFNTIACWIWGAQEAAPSPPPPSPKRTGELCVSSEQQHLRTSEGHLGATCQRWARPGCASGRSEVRTDVTSI